VRVLLGAEVVENQSPPTAEIIRNHSAKAVGAPY
ncbi:hypothetical protein LCGC14_1875540, partial [marine sediment metagenome]